MSFPVGGRRLQASRRPLTVVCGVLLVVLLLPTVCLLWFMEQAMRNELLALRQRLSEAYGGQVQAALQSFDAGWKERVEAVPSRGLRVEDFPRLLSRGGCDSVVLLDSQGRAVYPCLGEAPGATEEASGPGVSLEELILGSQEVDSAAWLDYCRDIESPATPSSTHLAEAYQALARAYVQEGNTSAAVAVLTGRLCEKRFEAACDRHERLLQPNAQLLALELIGAPQNDGFDSVMEKLRLRLNDYGEPSLSSAQRLFLMRRVQRLRPDSQPFATLEAEALANAFLEQGGEENAETPGFRPSRVPGVWSIRFPQRPVVFLLREQRLRESLCGALARYAASEAVAFEVVAPGQKPQTSSLPVVRLQAGELLRDWRIELRLMGDDPLTLLARRRNAFHYWSAALVIAVLAAATFLLSRVMLREMRLARLKNDLLSTVSHELKTPLTSIRALIEALMDEGALDASQRREYLEMVARENVRLTRLIDNFLTFSRMERNQHSLHFEKLGLRGVIEDAVEAAGERFRAMGERFELHVEEPLPAVMADCDALTSVVLNLLDNAYKYSGEERCISLRVGQSAEEVCISVADNGIGIARGAQKRVFERFYQADQSLARKAGGCGLGLSIVSYLVKAHGGRIEVETEPGKGSTFRVWLPCLASDSSRSSVGSGVS